MDNKKSIYTILLIFALACLALILCLDWPLLKEIKKNSKELVSAKNSVATLVAQNNETKNFKKNYETYKDSFDKIDKMFVDPDNPVNFIEFIEGVAQSSQITSQITLPPRSSGAQTFLMLQFISKGTLAGMLNFAEEIEGGPYFVEIQNLTIQGTEDKGTPKEGFARSVGATFAIKVFTKK